MMRERVDARNILYKLFFNQVTTKKSFESTAWLTVHKSTSH